MEQDLLENGKKRRILTPKRMQKKLRDSSNNRTSQCMEVSTINSQEKSTQHPLSNDAFHFARRKFKQSDGTLFYGDGDRMSEHHKRNRKNHFPQQQQQQQKRHRGANDTLAWSTAAIPTHFNTISSNVTMDPYQNLNSSPTKQNIPVDVGSTCNDITTTTSTTTQVSFSNSSMVNSIKNQALYSELPAEAEAQLNEMHRLITEQVSLSDSIDAQRQKQRALYNDEIFVQTNKDIDYYEAQSYKKMLQAHMNSEPMNTTKHQ
ncbi:hypothetical protein BDB00DRAFT_277169 [Zychaea mexicana]|uniref:uncharacterized protein n=1 Tax=Zychaea mexicana TaxID=64656 RepID=UPI0022FDF34A|nr:uncharacterized protein BDB00DRAFT_277169 [Zychaea mexicana]KAI9494888.1 hypothetical protein BDB00DRAFT_277169 [Zychaea mexicana]